MIQFLRGTASAAESANPILAAGQPFFETDTNKLKIGDGTSYYNQLPYLVDNSQATTITWDDVTGKPSVFTPASHTHSISDVSNLQTTLNGKASTSHTHSISDVTSLQTNLNGKMSSPSNTGSSGQWLQRYGSNQGTWASLPVASSSQSGMISSTLFSKLNNLSTPDAYISKAGNSNNSVTSGWYFLSDRIVLEWRQISVSNVAVTTSLGNWYRSAAPYTQTQYAWGGMSFINSSYPLVQMSFVTTNNAAALVWINPTTSYLQNYIPPCYLIRPTTGTCSGYIDVIAIGWNSYLGT